jgi:hypothetical protein
MPDSDAYFDHVNEFVAGRSQIRSTITYASSTGGAVAKVIICKRMPNPPWAPHTKVCLRSLAITRWPAADHRFAAV